jgi:hypothetical protein
VGGSPKKVLQPVIKVKFEDGVKKCSWGCTEPGTVSVKLDNSHSRFRSKLLKYGLWLREVAADANVGGAGAGAGAVVAGAGGSAVEEASKALLVHGRERVLGNGSPAILGIKDIPTRSNNRVEPGHYTLEQDGVRGGGAPQSIGSILKYGSAHRFTTPPETAARKFGSAHSFTTALEIAAAKEASCGLSTGELRRLVLEKRGTLL